MRFKILKEVYYQGELKAFLMEDLQKGTVLLYDKKYVYELVQEFGSVNYSYDEVLGAPDLTPKQGFVSNTENLDVITNRYSWYKP